MADDFASTGRTTMGATHPKPNSKWEERRAVRTVAHHALDAEDCVDLLEMLGLKAEAGKLSEAAALVPKPTPFNTRVREDSTPPRKGSVT